MERIAKATAICTGGGVYMYVGQLNNGDYFITADDYYDFVLFLDADPYSCLDMSCYEEWQSEHKIGGYSEEKAIAFKKLILEWIIAERPEGNYQASELQDRLSQLGQ